MYTIPKRFKAPISLSSQQGGIETEARFQHKVQRRFALACILTLFSGLLIGFTAGQVLGPASSVEMAAQEIQVKPLTFTHNLLK